MKETQFVDQNKAKWLEFEKELAQSEPKPHRVSHFYVETIDDLSFARTHYPNRLVRSYLNGLAESLSLRVQKSQKNYFRNFVQFWQRDLPLMMFEARNQFLLSFIILAVSIAIGIFSSMHDPSFANYILGDSYVKTTLANIEKGDPMAIYKDEARANMFLGITINNILVSVRTFLLSLFAGAGTLLVIIYNGVMLGVFQYFFIERGLFFESFLTIWQHGVIEISCIVLAGTAGLVLAKGILFPGTLSRLDAFRIAGRKSLVIMLGLMPLLVYSGAVEAFVTRYTEMHWSIRLFSILITFSFVLLYFVWYPRKVAQQQDWQLTFKAYLHPIQFSRFSFTKTQKNPTIIWESIRIMNLHKKTTGRALGILLLALISILTIAQHSTSSFYLYQSSLVGIAMFFNYSASPIFLIHFCVLFTALVLSQMLNSKHAKNAPFGTSAWKKNRGAIILASLVFALIFSFGYSYGSFVILTLLLFPAVGLFLATLNNEDGQFNFQKFWKWLKSSFGRLLSLVFILSAVIFLGSLLIQFVFGELFPQLLSSLISTQDHSSFINYLASYLAMAILFFAFYFVLFSSIGLSFFSIQEIQTAQNLKQRIHESFPDTGFASSQNPNLLSSSKLNRA
ncbi:stage II sporulation protein M [Xanthomarina gelatinilytica]|uniref:stage II sporulation protein M n=1 Tax=Xanthomarina gelatinilytica TaxID=1137281 RepID=UPI003AA83B32